MSAVHRRTREVVVEVLNTRGDEEDDTTAVDSGTTAAEDGVPGGGGRRRRSAAATYDVELVAVDPAVKDERLRTPVVAADQGQIPVPVKWSNGNQWSNNLDEWPHRRGRIFQVES